MCRAVLALLLLAFACHARAADPVVQRLVARLEAGADGCSDARPGTPDTRAMTAAIEHFRQAVPEAAAVPIELRECFWDGMVVRGQRIVLSTRLARATTAQRFFVIAHEYGHVAGLHHRRFLDRTANLLAAGSDEAAVAPALAPLSRDNEREADAFAVALMRRAGLDPEEAARFLDAADRGRPARPGDTHPTPGARAAAIRGTTAIATAQP